MGLRRCLRVRVLVRAAFGLLLSAFCFLETAELCAQTPQLPARPTTLPAPPLSALPAIPAPISARPAATQGVPVLPPAAPIAPPVRSAVPPPVPVTAPAQPREKTYFYSSDTVLPPPQPPKIAIVPAVLQPAQQPQPVMPDPAVSQGIDELSAYNIQLEVPGRKLFQLESEASLRERMRQEARKAGERLIFPEEPVLSKEPYAGRFWTPLTRLVEPNYVTYRRLLFEQKNFDRYGWDLGVFTPLVNAGQFYWDVAWLPYHAATRPFQQYETSAGHCLPGDPVPFLLYPPELSATGLAAQAGVVAGAFYIFP